ncbi:MAG: hypothetical protein K2Y71_12310 [Xanthobacteraceae bacterium]|nr:hypothetical protein [Xanthobacteraceae bacterium]
MVRRSLLGAAFALALTLGALAAAFAQSASSQPPAIEAWAHDFTVLTMAPDGAWGTATDSRINRAIHLAITHCKAMSGMVLGCGSAMTTVRGGWSLGIRCGRENIIVADRSLGEAEQRALRRETELRERYVRDMPPCARVVTVDPNGLIVAPTPDGYAGRLRPAR